MDFFERERELHAQSHIGLQEQCRARLVVFPTQPAWLKAARLPPPGSHAECVQMGCVWLLVFSRLGPRELMFGCLDVYEDANLIPASMIGCLDAVR